MKRGVVEGVKSGVAEGVGRGVWSVEWVWAVVAPRIQLGWSPSASLQNDEHAEVESQLGSRAVDQVSIAKREVALLGSCGVCALRLVTHLRGGREGEVMSGRGGGGR